MAKIKKIQRTVDGVLTTEYPVTIHQAVVDVETNETLDVTLTKKANHGYVLGEEEPKTLKQVDDEKADHGYASIEVAKTLKQVEDNARVKIENLVVNGDFSNGLSNWNLLGGGTTIDNGRMKVVASNSMPYPTYNVGSNTGDVCYISFTGHMESGVDARFMNANSSTVFIQSETPTRYSARYSASGSLIRFGTLSAPTSFVLYIDNIVLINLTETFGAGNEPTKEEMDLLISILGIEYFEGEITIPAQKVMQWQLKLIRNNKNAIIALGGTII